MRHVLPSKRDAYVVIVNLSIRHPCLLLQTKSISRMVMLVSRTRQIIIDNENNHAIYGGREQQIYRNLIYINL